MIVFWKDHSHRFVFSHEASYCPWIELPSGAGMCNQFFEGNLGDAELFNNSGRRERNSFVNVIQSGPQRVWVRWTYFCVNMHDDRKPRLHGTEDYFAYPNGLILRRMTYESLMPGEVVGYSTQPVELFGIAPVGATLKDMFAADEKQQEFRVLSALDLFSQKRYDIYWDEQGKVRRQGDDATLAAISRSRGLRPGHSLPRETPLRRARRGRRVSRGEEPVDRSLHAGRRGRLWVGSRAMGPLAHRLGEFADVVLETGLALSVQLRFDRAVLRSRRQADQIVLQRLPGPLQRYGTEPLDRAAGILRIAGRGPRLGRRTPHRAGLARPRRGCARPESIAELKCED